MGQGDLIKTCRFIFQRDMLDLARTTRETTLINHPTLLIQNLDRQIIQCIPKLNT